MADSSATVLMVAGEPSGDLHGSKVVARLLDLSPELRVLGVGGDRMAAAGMELVYHSDDFALLGFVEVLRHIPRLARAMGRLVRLSRERGVRVAILIDYPGFNLMLARRLRRAGVAILYYISPQVWAWGEGRVRKIAKVVDRMAVVLPFEERFYRERGVRADFVGHPLLDERWVQEVRDPKAGSGGAALLGLFPGSRRQEIARHVPPMLEAVRILRSRIPELRVKLGLAAGLDPGTLRGVHELGVSVVRNDAVHDLMREATALLVSSGTATLEAACVGTPMVVMYKMAPLSYLIGRLLVRIPYIGLVNVVAGEKVVPELIQGQATGRALAAAVEPFLTDPALRTATSRRLFAVRGLLGTAGASDRVARMAVAMAGDGA